MLIAIFLSGCTEGDYYNVSKETISTLNDIQLEKEHLAEEYLKSMEELKIAMNEKLNIFGGGLTYTDLFEYLQYQFKGYGYRDLEAAKVLDDMIDTALNMDLLYKKIEKDYNDGNTIDLKTDIEYIKKYIKIVRNDRKVMIECNINHNGKKLISYKNNDSLYKDLKQFLNSLQ